ncbi:ATPase [Microbacterium sp. EYE_5]|uniref:ATPase n=1 Tax=unclassified Microbacterium TaxID=2609290 RepID=UPI002006D91D|nr:MULTISPECIES: ATPase [unclassified Microbacterium]MCK6080717.1 ATPase [Microbacterium sp. EYE_382]MCK6085988.1 ATPase [Microbacterium sp. EYE_384]MCK6124514.1 ATPase [Microbacterium sp. EYE_80]MCK6127423.1 ATPase [Microbacterium sp. EYE_79]MCK6141672.1 ATPase [Microbacterium sp. EYE_39]
MKNVLWFLLGIAGGFVAAHLVNKDPRGQELLAEVDARISEFTDRMADAYHAQEAKIDGIVADAKSVAADVADDVKDAASDLADGVAAAGRSAAAKHDD